MKQIWMYVLGTAMYVIPHLVNIKQSLKIFHHWGTAPTPTNEAVKSLGVYFKLLNNT
jgi:hypothetical protein